jgi:hypothetical protein
MMTKSNVSSLDENMGIYSKLKLSLTSPYSILDTLRQNIIFAANRKNKLFE